MKKLYLILCLLVSGPTVANPNNYNIPNSLLFQTIDDNPSAYQATLDLLCPSVEKLAKSLYTYANWGLTYNTAIVHVRKQFFKRVPEGTLGREQALMELQNEVEYILVSHNKRVGLEEVIHTTTQSCWSTFDTLS